MKKDKKWLSDRWDDLVSNIKERNKYYEGYDKALMDIVPFIDQLDEPEQVVIPQFVADYIEIAKQDITLMRVFDIAQNHGERDMWEKEYEWIRANHDKFAKAWFGYTVEKEKLYRVRLPITVWDEESSELQEHWYYLVYDNTSDETRLIQSLRAYEHYQAELSETLIKSIDERFWAFAEEVAE